MNKQINTALAIAVIIIIAGTLGSIVWMSKNSQEQTTAKSQPIVKETPPQKAETKNPTSQEITPSIKTGYKVLRVSDGTTSFSFQIPEKWLTETRHSGEKQLTVEEMRDFLATNYDGNIKTNPDLTSDYADFPWDMLKKMSTNDIRKYYFRDDTDMPFPNASVAAGDHIWYTDTSWEQIDFRFQNEIVSNVVASVKKEQDDFCKKYDDPNMVGCGNDKPKWSKTIIDSNNVDVVTYSTDKDKKGNEVISKGGSGGKVFYVEIPNSNKTLIITKQAKGDTQFENDFEYLIQTLKIEK